MQHTIQSVRASRPRLDVAHYGPWAVVTGASSGIGRGFATHLAAAGFNIVLVARRTRLLVELGGQLSSMYGVAHRVVTSDLSAPDGADAVIAAATGLDVGLVISNAGSGLPGPYLMHDRADLQRFVRLNVHAHLDLTHHFGRRLVARGGGGMVLVSAVGALHGLPHMVNDSATKAYVLNLGEGLHHELAPHGVDVTVLLPGAVDTPIIEHFGIDRATLPVRPQTVEACVDEALWALRRHRATHVSGWAVRTMTRLVPRALSIRMNARMLGARAGAGVDAGPPGPRARS